MEEARVSLTVTDEMEKQLRQIFPPLQSYAEKRGQIISKAFGREETNRVTACVADILDRESPCVSRAKKLIVIEALAAMLIVGEMLRARRADKYLFDVIDQPFLVAHFF
jgi:hypothetical protein